MAVTESDLDPKVRKISIITFNGYPHIITPKSDDPLEPSQTNLDLRRTSPSTHNPSTHNNNKIFVTSDGKQIAITAWKWKRNVRQASRLVTKYFYFK